MKKILFLIPTLSGGGAEKVLVNLVNNLDKKKYLVTVKTLFNVGVNRKYLNDDIEYKYIFKKNFRGSRFLLKFFKPETLYKYMIKENYDIVVSYLEGSTTRIVSGCKNKQTKLVNWVHNEYHDEKKIGKYYRSIDESINCYNKYDYTVFVAESARDAFPKIFNLKNTNVLYNTVETEQVRKLSLENVEDIQFDESKINLISVGRYTKQKGYERLLEILSKLIYEEKMNLHLYLLGQGELEDEYTKIINDNKLSNNVTLLGYKNNPYKYLKKSDLFVCSSYHEGFSTVVTESLIVGTSVITTLCSGMKELLSEDGKYGVIVENTDKDLYLGLKTLLNNKEEMTRLKRMAKERGKSFNKANTVKAVESFFDSMY